MLKLKTTILSVMVTALILTPFLAFAQSGPAPITKAELDAVSTAAKLASQQHAKGDSSWIATAQDAKTKCLAVGAKLEQITSLAYTTIWTGPEAENELSDFTCAGASNSTIWYDSYDSLIHSLLIGVQEGRVKEISLQSYLEWQTQKNVSSSDPAWWERALNLVFVTVANILASILAGLAIMALKILDTVISWTNSASTPQVVYDTWAIVRDFMNLLFISALIVMAIATIIRYEAYNYKRLLRNLILMAVLINFSLVIATTLIAFSNMLIMTLKPEGTIIEYGKTIYPAFVTNGQGFVGGFLGQDYSFAAGLGNSVTKIASLVFITVAFGAIAIMMLIRMIGLWFMVMVSPAAYALNVLPATQGLAKRWWNEFFKFLIWGPVAMFFIRIGLSLIVRGSQGQSAISTSETWLNNLFIAAFIWGGFLVAKNVGQMGSSAVTSAADKYARSGAKFATSAYGNYFWRGTAAGHAAGAATYLTSRGDWDKTKTAFKDTRDAVGKSTAWVENEPKRQMDKWVNVPNKDRSKLVEKEDRRTRIRRGYFKDMDEETAKKFSAEDLAYALTAKTPIRGKQKGINDDVLKGLAEHGKPTVKLALAKAYEDGHISRLANDGRIDRHTEQEAFNKLREYVFTREMGGRKSDIPPDFMVYDPHNPSAAFKYKMVNGTTVNLISSSPKKKDYETTYNNDPFDNKVKKSDFQVDPDRQIRNDLKQKNRADQELRRAEREAEKERNRQQKEAEAEARRQAERERRRQERAAQESGETNGGQSN